MPPTSVGREALGLIDDGATDGVALVTGVDVATVAEGFAATVDVSVAMDACAGPADGLVLG
jgi:hypothetical protein